MNLKPWKKSGNLTPTRTMGEIEFVRNGTSVDIWIRQDCEEKWYAVNYKDLLGFLVNSDSDRSGRILLEAESDGNSEESKNEFTVTLGFTGITDMKIQQSS